MSVGGGGLAIPDVPATSRGPDGVRRFFRLWVGTFEGWAYEVEEVIDAGDAAVAVHIHQWGRGRGSGRGPGPGVPRLCGVSAVWAFLLRTIAAIRCLARDERIPKPLRVIAGVGLLPIPGPLDEVFLVLLAPIFFGFYRRPMHDAWARSKGG
ncbi:MAG: hypothetical protein K0R88_2826 [Solirubrobacterales bacterium]|jgi:hypothetical protein|nr:hypothetical protein [Solirubrobacterales bacterium]